MISLMNFRLPIFCATLVSLVLTKPAAAQSLTFNLQSLGSPDASYIEFTPEGGDNLQVTFQPNAAAEDFTISGASNPGLNSLTGSITGSFLITGFNSGTLEQGTVTSSPSASLVISDGLGDTETAHIWWNSAYTLLASGSLSSFDMNSGSSQDLSQFTYSGTANSALQQDFSGISSGHAVVSFSFASTPNSLTELAAEESPTTDSFSGQVSEIPEPSNSTSVLAAAALGAAAIWRLRRPAPAI